MNIDTMPAGRKMDALIAKKVMNFKIHTYECPMSLMSKKKKRCCCFPNYSTNITAAWEVFEHLKKMKAYKNSNLCIKLCGGNYSVGDVSEEGILFWNVNEDPDCVLGGISDGSKTAPLAICRTALKAVNNLKN